MVMSVDDLKELTMNGADFGAVHFGFEKEGFRSLLAAIYR
jgi:hypothetical protein